MSSPLLELKKISVSFEGFLALRDLDLVLNKGDLRAVIGPNGAGKTSLFKLITASLAEIKSLVSFTPYKEIKPPNRGPVLVPRRI